MSKKRFTMKGSTILENDEEITAWDCCDLLNELNDDNCQLKRQIGNLEHTKDFCADVCADCERLEKENEQLKQFIYDNLDEDICDVCSYQYLEKSQMDKYYVAKCKKGYDNCSKGTVIHCKDFKFKELKE